LIKFDLKRLPIVTMLQYLNNTVFEDGISAGYLKPRILGRMTDMIKKALP